MLYFSAVRVAHFSISSSGHNKKKLNAPLLRKAIGKSRRRTDVPFEYWQAYNSAYFIYSLEYFHHLKRGFPGRLASGLSASGRCRRHSDEYLALSLFRVCVFHSATCVGSAHHGEALTTTHSASSSFENLSDHTMPSSIIILCLFYLTNPGMGGNGESRAACEQ